MKRLKLEDRLTELIKESINSKHAALKVKFFIQNNYRRRQK